MYFISSLCYAIRATCDYFTVFRLSRKVVFYLIHYTISFYFHKYIFQQNIILNAGVFRSWILLFDCEKCLIHVQLFECNNFALVWTPVTLGHSGWINNFLCHGICICSRGNIILIYSSGVIQIFLWNIDILNY